MACDLAPADVCQQVNRGETTFSVEYRELAEKILQLLPYAQEDPYAYSYNDACTAFARGESAMYCIGSYAVPQIKSVNPDMNIDSFVFPANDSADGQILNSGVDLQFCVMETAKTKKPPMRFCVLCWRMKTSRFIWTIRMLCRAKRETLPAFYAGRYEGIY